MYDLQLPPRRQNFEKKNKSDQIGIAKNIVPETEFSNVISVNLQCMYYNKYQFSKPEESLK